MRRPLLAFNQLPRLLLSGYGLLVVGLPLAGLGYALLGSVGLAGPLAAGFTGRYWGALGHDTGLLTAALFSAAVAGAVLLLSGGLALALVLGAPGALRRGPLLGLLYVPLLLPALVVAFYLFQLLSRGGWASRLSYQAGLTGSLVAFPELVQDAAGVGIVLAHVLLTFPFLALLFQAIYQESRLDDYYPAGAHAGGQRGAVSAAGGPAAAAAPGRPHPAAEHRNHYGGLRYSAAAGPPLPADALGVPNYPPAALRPARAAGRLPGRLPGGGRAAAFAGAGFAFYSSPCALSFWWARWARCLACRFCC